MMMGLRYKLPLARAVGLSIVQRRMLAMLPPMSIYSTWLRPLLFTQDPESVHHRAMAGMRLGLSPPRCVN